MSLAEVDESSGTIALFPAGTSYVVRIEPDRGTVRHVHWGDRLALREAVALPAEPGPGDSFGDAWDGAEELPVDGGLRYGPPALEVRYADGTGPLEPHLVGFEVERGGDAWAEVRVNLRDAARPLDWTLHYRVHAASPVVERWTEYRHGRPSGADVLLVRHASAQWNLPVRSDYRMSGVFGQWAGEFALQRRPLAVGETTLTSRRGHTGHQSNPWVAIDAGDATETDGQVWCTATATSGSWRIEAVRSPEGRCGVICGAGHEGVEVSLAAGTSWTSAVSVGVYSAAGFGGVSRALHAYVREHVLPAPERPRPVLYNSWEATSFEVTFANQRRLADAAAELGAELFVVDDGWFGRRDDDRAGLGDWTPHRRRFPDGLRPLSDHVHGLGMRFGLWVEPEMVNVDSDLYRAHPDWVLHLPDRTPSVQRHQLVLDFSRPAVTDWAYEWLSRTIGAYDVDFLKWDFNRSFSEAGSHGDRRDRRAIFMEHAAGVHGVLDRLRRDHPRLEVESCAGGGGRVDLAVLARTDQVWTSDNTDAVDRLRIQYGFSQVYPAQVMSAWVTDSPNPMTGRTIPLRFRFHCAMAGALGIGGDLTRWSRQEREEAAGMIALYKEVREVVQHGRQYRLGSPDDLQHGVLYVSRDRSEAVVLQWRVGAATRTLQPRLRLPGLDPDAVYTLRDDSGTLGSVSVTGAALAAHGLPAGLPAGPYSSRLLRLRGR
ncbi:alpha-galactosidase [Streptomyces sp. NPDC057382]|uniref:alpha-galactosidase n=1 Tax=unclassified Streptomyces TaxID=2593676 RepID=UPI0036251CF5